MKKRGPSNDLQYIAKVITLDVRSRDKRFKEMEEDNKRLRRDLKSAVKKN